MSKFLFSCILSATKEKTVGTKLSDKDKFLSLLDKETAKVDFENQRVIGQAKVSLPAEAYDTVSCGVGKRTLNQDDYCIRVNRGEVNLYLKREYAASVANLDVIVYTKDAYLDDPDTKENPEEFARISAAEVDYIVVAILASAEVPSELTYLRFAKNLAGSNKKYDLDVIVPDNGTIETIRENIQSLKEEAARVADYNSHWAVVAD